VSRYQIDVTTDPRYLPEQSDPTANRYVFAYHITLYNSGEQAAQLLNRHWIITDGNGRVEEVRGSGVVGEQPLLRPGEDYSYTSGVMLQTPVGTMQGRYQMQADDDQLFDAEIPIFTLSAPHSLN